MKKLYQSFILLVFAALLASCAQLELLTPQTFNQKVAVAYATVTQVRESATQLVIAKKITAVDAMNVQSSADIARLSIETAREMHAKDPQGAQAKLEAIKIGLQALVNYLNSQDKK